MKPTRWTPMLLVDPKLSRHPTLVGERLAGTYKIIGAAGPPRLSERASAGAWLMICAASACAVVIMAGLLG